MSEQRPDNSAIEAPQPVKIEDDSPLVGKRSYEMDEALLAKEMSLLKDLKQLQDRRPNMEITDAMVAAGLDGWFSVKPSAAESDAVLERSMRAALKAALAVSSNHRGGEQ